MWLALAVTDAAGRLWEAAWPLRDRRIPVTCDATATETYRLALPREAHGPLTVRAALNYRAAAGYLSSLMTIYLGLRPVPSAPRHRGVAADETIVRLR